jgi:hypothetical protein
MEQVFVFHLRVYVKIGGVNECVWDDGVDVCENSYQEAEIEAKKEFVRRHPPLKDFEDFDKIEVCDWDMA